MRRAALIVCAVGPLLLAGCAAKPRGRARPQTSPASEAAKDDGLTPSEASTSSVDSSAEPTVDLFNKRLVVHGGAPVMAIRLMEGADEVTFSAQGRMRLHLPGPVDRRVEAPAGAVLKIRARETRPAELKVSIQLAEFPFADRAGLAAETKLWESRGVAVRAHTLGAVFGISGQVVDNRRSLLLVDAQLDPAKATERQAELLRKYGVRTTLFEELVTAPSGTLELFDEAGALLGAAQERIDVETLGGEPLEVRRVEFGVGYPYHGFEDRTYRGGLRVTIDRNGRLAAVNLVGLEDFLLGLVPAEIFARAPLEALKAQAVTARGEVLAKVGLKHLADPYLLCAEQHCAVYRGKKGEVASTNEAVEQTRGEALFDSSGRLVDSVYSAVCGGHTEDNDVVWGGPPNPSLRGKPDLLSAPPAPINARDTERFLAADLRSACRLSSFAQPSKYRWERRFSAQELNALTAHLGVGEIQAITATARGVSGRIRLLTLSGETGATQLRGELNIRKLFGMLNSAMFTVRKELGPDGKISAWVFQGGGWGHGVGMCQTGAIGRAEAGHDYRRILEHYYNGAQVLKIY